MNDEMTLSLYLDGHLAPDEAAAFEARLAAEPALSQQLAALRRLQELSEDLPETEAEFTADDVRVRARANPGRGWWWRTGVAAAAVLVLAVSHGAVYVLGQHRGAAVAERERPPVLEAEDFLARAAELDIDAPPERLRSELADLRAGLRPQLIALDNQRTPRATRMAEALRQMDMAFDVHQDPGFLGITLAVIAQTSLNGKGEIRFLPGSAHSRVVPVGEGRYRVFLMEPINGVPNMLVDEGSLPELERRHPNYKFVTEKE